MNTMSIEGLIRTIIDGLKDSSMQYEWACNAQRAGDKEIASMHHAEAMKRLNNVKEWYDKAKNFVGDKPMDHVGEVMKNYFVNWYRDLLGKVSSMKI